MSQLEAILAAALSDESLYSSSMNAFELTNMNDGKNSTPAGCNPTPMWSPNDDLPKYKVDAINDAEGGSNNSTLDNVTSSLFSSLTASSSAPLVVSSTSNNGYGPIPDSFKSNDTTSNKDSLPAKSSTKPKKKASTCKDKNCAKAESDALLRGVTLRPSGKWQAQVYFMGKSRYIGVFDAKEKAALAYEVARGKLKALRKLNAVFTEDTLIAARNAASEAVNEMYPEKAESSEGGDGRVAASSTDTLAAEPKMDNPGNGNNKDNRQTSITSNNKVNSTNWCPGVVPTVSMDTEQDECCFATDAVGPKATTSNNNDGCDRKKPIRPLSAYNLFFQHEREKIISRNATLSMEGNSRINFKDLVRTIAEKWKDLDEDAKNIYKELSFQQHIQYKKDQAKWTQLNKQNSKSHTLNDENMLPPSQELSMVSPSPMKMSTSTGTSTDLDSLLQSPALQSPMISNKQQEDCNNNQDRTVNLHMHMHLHTHTHIQKPVQAADVFVSPHIMDTPNKGNSDEPEFHDFSSSTGGWLSPFPLNSTGGTQLLNLKGGSGWSPLPFRSNGKEGQTTGTEPTVSKLSVPLFDNDAQDDRSFPIPSSCSKFVKKTYPLAARSSNSNDLSAFLMDSF